MHRAPSTNVTIDLSLVSGDFISIFMRGRDGNQRKKECVVEGEKVVDFLFPTLFFFIIRGERSVQV